MKGYDIFDWFPHKMGGREKNGRSIGEGSLAMSYLLKLENGYMGIYYTVLTTLVFVWKFL